MARSYRMTPKRRAALKKAQLASARKRRRLNRKQKVAIGVASVVAAGLIAHKASGSKLSISRSKNVSRLDGRNLGNGIRSPHFGKTTSILIGHGATKTSVSYRFGRDRGIVTGRRTRNAVDHDTIPFYNPGSSKSWPHVDPDKARKQNQKLRRLGMAE